MRRPAPTHPTETTLAERLTIPLLLSPEEAAALAQFVKRADRDTARRHAGDQGEADSTYEAWIQLRLALADAGFAPR